MPDPLPGVSPISTTVDARPGETPHSAAQPSRDTTAPVSTQLTWKHVAVISFVFVFAGWLLHSGEDLQTAVGVPLVLLAGSAVVLRPGALFVMLRRVAQAFGGNPDKP